MWNHIILDVECIVCNKSLQKIHDPRGSTKMGKITNNRRLRTPNWSLEEKQYLLELIKQRKEVVVTKTNNGPNFHEEKDVAWNEILRELAVRFGNKFTDSSIKKVKTQWQNMKRIAREEISLNGSALQNYSRLSLDVCNITDLVKDGVLNSDEHLNETSMSNIESNIEIKTERIEEDSNQPQPSCSGINNNMSMDIDNQHNKSLNIPESSSSVSDVHISDINESETTIEISVPENRNAKSNNTTSTVEIPNLQEVNNIVNPFHRELKEYFKYTAAEKQLKMESLKEERQVIRAMRETAELNKIIAEQKLKHVLWVKNQEVAMYAKGSDGKESSGSAGAIRDAGGAFGKMEAAREDEYFYKKQKEQLANLKTHLDKEIAFHQEQIKRHEDAIRRHREKMSDMDQKQ